MFMFFLNKPVSIYPYLAGFIAIVIWSLKVWAWKDDIDPVLSFIVNLGGFSSWYYIFLIRYYILGGEELFFWKIPLSRFQGIFDFYLTFYAVLILALNIIILITHRGGPASFVFGFVFSIFYCIFEKIVKVKFISEGFKHNSSIKEMKLNDIYQELREVATKKLIESEENY